jgi:hypothetical protein
MDLGSVEFWERLVSDPARLAFELCRVDVNRLDLTLQRHPALRAWINAAHEAARIDEERARWDVTRTRAHVLLEARETLDGVTNKAKTVDVLNAEADGHADVAAAMGALLDAQRKRGALRAMADALEDRLQMLIQISAKQRVELRDYTR